MIDPALAFKVAGQLAVLSWLALIVAAFWAPARRYVWTVTIVVVPALIAVAYIVLIAAGMRAGGGGGFGSIPEVRALFANDSALAAGWLHYLAFDLFVGSWIAREGVRCGIHPLLLVPCFALTFLFGPAGLLLFLVLRLVVARRFAVVAE